MANRANSTRTRSTKSQTDAVIADLMAQATGAAKAIRVLSKVVAIRWKRSTGKSSGCASITTRPWFSFGWIEGGRMMDKITRRAALAAIPAAGLAPIVPAMATPVDPLLDLIAEYRRQMVDYDINCPNDSEGMDAYAGVTFLPPMRRIENWSEPARTAQGAREALRLALQESENFMSSDMTPPLPSRARLSGCASLTA